MPCPKPSSSSRASTRRASASLLVSARTEMICGGHGVPTRRNCVTAVFAIRRWLADSETATGFDPAAGTELANARRMDADLGNPKSSQMGHWDVRQDRKEMGAGRHRAQFALFVWATVLLVLASLAS